MNFSKTNVLKSRYFCTIVRGALADLLYISFIDASGMGWRGERWRQQHSSRVSTHTRRTHSLLSTRKHPPTSRSLTDRFSARQAVLPSTPRSPPHFPQTPLNSPDAGEGTFPPPLSHRVWYILGQKSIVRIDFASNTFPVNAIIFFHVQYKNPLKKNRRQKFC